MSNGQGFIGPKADIEVTKESKGFVGPAADIEQPVKAGFAPAPGGEAIKKKEPVIPAPPPPLSTTEAERKLRQAPVSGISSALDATLSESAPGVLESQRLSGAIPSQEDVMATEFQFRLPTDAEFDEFAQREPEVIRQARQDTERTIQRISNLEKEEKKITAIGVAKNFVRENFDNILGKDTEIFEDNFQKKGFNAGEAEDLRRIMDREVEREQTIRAESAPGEENLPSFLSSRIVLESIKGDEAKIYSDYTNFLQQSDPEKLALTKQRAREGRFTEEREHKFFIDAAQHQSSLIEAKVARTAEKFGKDAIDLTVSQIIQKFSDDADIAKLSTDFRSLQRFTRHYVQKFPKVYTEILARQQRQEDIDAEYERAKGALLLPGAKETLLRYNILNPTGRASVGFIKGLLTLPRTVLPGESSIESKLANDIADLADAYWDVEKSTSIYKQPSALKGSLIEKEEGVEGGYKVNWETLPSKTVEGIITTLGLLGGASAVGTGLKAIGVAETVAGATGLVASSFVLTHNDYYVTAIEQGLSQGEASAFATTSATLTGLLENINPQKFVFGGQFRKNLAKETIRFIKDGVTRKDAVKRGTKFALKQIGFENIQESAQMLGDKVIEYGANKVFDKYVFDPEIKPEEVLETIILTTIQTAIISGAPALTPSSELERQANYNAGHIAIDDPRRIVTALEREVAEGRFTLDEVDKVSEKIDKYAEIIKGLPDNLSEMQKSDAADLIFKKQQIKEKQTEGIVDDIIEAKQDDQVKIINERLDDVVEGKVPDIQKEIPKKEEPELKPLLQKFTTPTDEMFGFVNRRDGKGNIPLTKEEFEAEQAKPKEDVDRKDEERLPGEEQIRKEPVTEEPVAEGREEATPTGRVFQEAEVIEEKAGDELAQELTEEDVAPATQESLKGKTFEKKSIPVNELTKLDTDFKEFVEEGEIADVAEKDIDRPIIVNSDGEIIDGFNRAAAKIAAGETNIDAYVAKEKIDITEDISITPEQELEDRFAELDEKGEFTSEMTEIEKELEKRERSKIFDIPLSDVNKVAGELIKKERDPSTLGIFTEIRDLRESKAVASRYLKAEELTDQELKNDFSDAVLGNPDTWYADGLKLRESLNEATRRGITTDKLFKPAILRFIRDGFSEKDAEGVIRGKLKSILEGAVTEEQIKAKKELEAKAPAPITGKARIADALDALAVSIGAVKNIVPNQFNQPKVFDAMVNLAKVIVEETGLQGQKLIAEIKKQLKARFGDAFTETDIDEVTPEIIEKAKKFKKAEPVAKEKVGEPVKKPVVEKAVEKKPKVEEPKVKERMLAARARKGTEKAPEVKEVVSEAPVVPPVGPISEELIDDSDRIQRGFQKRSLEAAEETEAQKQVKSVVEGNRDYYEQMNINKAVDEAAELISEKGGFEDAHRDLIKKSKLTELPIRQVQRELSMDHFGKKMDEAVKEGNTKEANKMYDLINDLQEIASKEATTAGQASAMLMWWKHHRPDGTVAFMERKIRDHNEKQEKKPKIKSKKKKIIKKIRDIIKEPAEGVEEELLDKEALKRRERGRKKIDEGLSDLADIIGARKKVIEENPLVNKSALAAIIKISDGLMDMGVATAEDLITRIKKEVLAHLSPSQIDEFKDEILEGKDFTENLKLKEERERKARITKLTNRQKKLLHKDLQKEVGKKRAKTLTEKIIQHAEDGTLTDESIADAIAEDLGLASKMTAEQASKLKQLAEIVQKNKGKGIFERDATVAMLRHMDDLYPTKDRVNTFFSLFYASILSGLTTSALNMISAGSNIITKPVRNVVSLSLWYRAARKGIEEKSWKAFKAYNPMNELLYMPSAFARGASKGATAFKEIWTNGAMDNKFMEQVANKNFTKLTPLERQKFGKDAFSPLNITIKGKKVSVNPFNYAKYVGRALAAEDGLMFNTVYDMEIAGLIHEALAEKGLRGKELRKAVFDEFLAKNIDKEAILRQVDEETAEFEKDAGIKVSDTKKKIRFKEISEERLDAAMRVEAEELARDNIFTGDRGGLIANTARIFGNIGNRTIGGAILVKPFVPFTRVVGNVGEFMMDTTPIYGQMRALGFGFTGIAQKITGGELRTSQLGEKGSRKYYEQMGRAWTGTLATLVAGFLFIGTDEDDFLEISGGHEPEGFKKRGRENVLPKYSIRIGDVIIPYLNIPTLAIPLALIGNYNDRLKLGDKEEDLFSRLTAATLNTGMIFKDMTFLEGVQRLFALLNDVFSAGEDLKAERIRAEETLPERAYREINESKLIKGLFKQYYGTVTRILPQNFNIVQQTWKLFDPTSFSQKEIDEILAYGLSIHRFTNNPNVDVFGETIKTFPGETLLPYTHWIGLKGKDERWKFLAKHNSIPSAIYNKQMAIGDEYRRLTADELFKYSKRTGKLFNDNLLKYMGDFAEVVKREKDEIKERGKIITGVQKDVKDLWVSAKKDARAELGLGAAEDKTKVIFISKN